MQAYFTILSLLFILLPMESRAESLRCGQIFSIFSKSIEKIVLNDSYKVVIVKNRFPGGHRLEVSIYPTGSPNVVSRPEAIIAGILAVTLDSPIQGSRRIWMDSQIDN